MDAQYEGSAQTEAPLPSGAQHPEAQSELKAQKAAHEGVLAKRLVYAQVVLGQQAPGLSRQEEPVDRHVGEQYRAGAHTDAVPVVSGSQHPVVQSIPETQSRAHVPFTGERASTTHISPRQQAAGLPLQVLPSG